MIEQFEQGEEIAFVWILKLWGNIKDSATS